LSDNKATILYGDGLTLPPKKAIMEEHLKDFLLEDIEFYRHLEAEIEYYKQRAAVRSLEKNVTMVGSIRTFMDLLNEHKEIHLQEMKKNYGDETVRRVFAGHLEGNGKPGRSAGPLNNIFTKSK